MDTGLRDLLRIAASDVTYKMLSRRIISRKLIELYQRIKAEKLERLSDASNVAITADYWTSITNDSYLGVYAHSINKEQSLESFTIGIFNFTECHTAKNIEHHIDCVLQECNLSEKITLVRTDNAGTYHCYLMRIFRALHMLFSFQ